MPEDRRATLGSAGLVAALEGAERFALPPPPAIASVGAQEPMVCRLFPGGRWIRTFGSRTRHQAVRPRRGRFPVIGCSPHWPGGTVISNLRPLAGWISALERGRFQGHKQKRKLKSVAPFARNRKFESSSLQRRVRLSAASTF